MHVPPNRGAIAAALAILVTAILQAAEGLGPGPQDHPKREKERHHERAPDPDRKPAAAWFLTMHGESGGNTVLALDADGRTLGPAIGDVPEAEGGPLKDLRGMARLQDGSLLVVNAFKDNTFVARFGAGDGSSPRPFLNVPIRGGAGNPALVHPYQVALAADGTIYLSNQDTNTVTRYAPLDGPEAGRPLPPPPSLADVPAVAPGTFVASESQVKDGLREVRGILVAPDGSVLVADKKRSSVLRLDARSGHRLAVVLGPEHGAKAPIQLALAPDGILLVGDNEREVIWRVPLAGGEIRALIDCANEGTKAPSAIAIDGKTLLVGSRSGRRIDRFDLVDGTRIGVFAEHLPDAPEFLLRVSP